MRPSQPRRRWHPALSAAVAAVMLAAVAACGGPSGARGTAATPGPSIQASVPDGVESLAGAASPTPSASASPTSGGSSKRFMGSSTILIGASTSDNAQANAALNTTPFDMRYSYVVSRPALSSDYYSASRCGDGWNWWGCWVQPPGGIVSLRHAQLAKSTYKGSPRPQKMFWTWFVANSLGPLAGTNDTTGAVGALNRADLLTLYMNDYRFFLQKIGKSHDIIHLEPDFWGFARSQGSPHQVPAAVTAANPTDCGSQENSVAGLTRCLIAMTRKYAPNASVGLHLTCWDWPGNEQKCVKDYADLGAKNGDFLVADVSDRDAGWYAKPANGGSNAFWTDQKAAAFLKWIKMMADSTGKPVVLWQIPLGNMAQNNTPNHYQDDKVDWLFAHMDQVANAHVAALLFGAGEGEQTHLEHDGGNLVRKTIAYNNSGGTPLK